MAKPTHNWPLRRKVEIEWIDSCSSTRWESIDYYRNNTTTSVCRSTGYLLRKTEDEIVLVQSMSGSTDNVAESIAIPMIAVVKVRQLRGGL